MVFGWAENVYGQGHVAFVGPFFQAIIVAKKGVQGRLLWFCSGTVVSGFHEFAAYSKYREIKEKGYYISGIKAKV